MLVTPGWEGAGRQILGAHAAAKLAQLETLPHEVRWAATDRDT